MAIVVHLLYENIADQQRQDARVARTYQVMSQFHALAETMARAESSQRGFLLTGDSEYLAKLEAVLREEQSLRQNLRRLLADNVHQQIRLNELDGMFDARAARLRTAIATFQQRGLSSALATIRLDDGSARENLRRMISAAEQAEQEVMAQQSQAAESRAIQTNWMLGFGAAALLSLLAAAGFIIEHVIKNLDEARTAERNARERLRLALDSANAGIWEWDLATNRNAWSDELWKLYGLEPNSCTPSYEAWRQILHPDDRSEAEKAVGDATRFGVELNVEFRVRNREGRDRWLLARAQPMRDKEGKPRSFIGIALDITHRKRAEELLREREEIQRRFTESAPVAIAMFDQEMRYLAASRRYREDYKLQDVDLLGRSHYEIFPEIPDAWREIHRRCLKGAVERSDGEPFRRADGIQQWVRWEIQPWRTANGEIGGVVLFSEDITTQKRAEQALRDEEGRLRLAQEVARIGTFERDFETGLATWTPELEAIYGLSPGAFDGKFETLENLIHPDDRSRAVEQIYRALDTGKLETEWRTLRPDGTVRWIAGRGSAFRDATGKPVRLVGVNIDITDAKTSEQALRQAHAELRQSEQRFRQVFENAPTAIGIFALAGEMEDCNPAFCRLLGYTPEELRQLGFLSLVHPEDRAARLAELDEIQSGKIPYVENESRYVRQGGEIVWVHKFLSLLPQDDGKPRVLRLLTDISEMKRANLEIRRLNAELECRVNQRTAELQAANKELEAFSYSVSHDLRAPLRGIDGWSLALAEDYQDQLDERAQQYLHRVRSETQRMGLLIDDMLRLSRISSGELRLARVDLTGIARGIVQELEEANSERTFEFTICPGLTAFCDARLMRIALTNLLSNAVKFTAPRTPARIEFSRTNGAFCVRDNGIGFDMAYAGSLFGAFQRLHRPSEFPGSGIGLAIVQRVIRRHGGRVWAQAQLGLGASFHFTIGSSS